MMWTMMPRGRGTRNFVSRNERQRYFDIQLQAAVRQGLTWGYGMAGIVPTGVDAFKIVFREPKRLFGGPEAVRTVVVDASNNVGVAAQSYKNGSAEYQATALLKHADMTESQRAVVAQLRAQVAADFTGESPIGVGLETAFTNTWKAGVEVQSVEGLVRSHKTVIDHGAVVGAKQLSHEIIPDNPKNSNSNPFADFLHRGFDLNWDG
ncbi:MAG: hypothetical protein JWM25_403 [Thermoleophilia bacterium]|nr:hypothetical protein [Thermoleophilia bacterium]MCZ4495820.1 hypothetical protein [Thermoleophilia bacterium]